MKGLSRLVIAVVFCVWLVGFVCGCSEQNTGDNSKFRLLAVENADLKEQLAACREEVTRQQELVTKCREDKKAAVDKARYDAESLSKFLIDENKKLAEENQKLKEKIDAINN